MHRLHPQEARGVWRRLIATSEAPDSCRYSKEHEWARIEGDSAFIGITDYAAHELGDVVYVQLPAIGSKITQFRKLGEIESVKAVSDLFAPISGEISEVNQALEQNPELVNDSPFQNGWMVKVRLANASEAAALLDATAYKDFLQGLDS